LAIDGIHCREVVHVFQEDGGLEDLGETGASGFEHRLQVFEDAGGLGFDASGNNLAGGRIERNLTGGIEKVSDANGLRIGPIAAGAFSVEICVLGDELISEF